MKITMKYLILGALACFSAFGQTATTQTTISTAMDRTQGYVNLVSATNVSANGFIFADGETMTINGNYVSGTYVPVTRGASGTRAVTHAVSVVAFVFSPGNPAAGLPNQARTGLINYDLYGSCVRADQIVLPRINSLNSKVFDCQAGRWGRILTQYVPPTSCGTAQTTSTATNTYITVGASAVMVLNSVSNAAAGTTTLVCDFLPPTSFSAVRSAVLLDIVSAVGSQVTAPTSLGTSTLGIVTFPTPTATTETASVVTPVAAGSTVTTVGPTTTVLTVTTAGAFLTFKHTYADPIVLTTDLQRVHFTFPFLQSAAAAMTVNFPGLWVHYFVTEN